MLIHKDKLKNIFFFFIGIYSTFFWNSMMNLNNFFINSFNNPNITKIYTMVYFLLSVLTFYITYKLDKYVSVFKSLKISCFIMVITFNLLYFICKYLEVNFLKYFLFILAILIFSNVEMIYNVI